MRIRASLIFLGLALTQTAFGAAPDAVGSWDLVHSEGALSVHRAASAERPTYKAEGIIDANLFELLAVLSDVERRIEWVKDLTETRILAGSVENQVVIYEQFDLPWPCSDRDSVVESSIAANLELLELTVKYHETEHANAPARESVVRMPAVRGSMFFKYVDARRSLARFEISLDVGGALPEWVVDQFVKKAPVATLNGLLRQVERTKGRYRDFIQRNQEAARTRSTVTFELLP